MNDLEFYVHSVWGQVQEKWEGNMRSNSMYRILDLNMPGTYGFHIQYDLNSEVVNYILITLDAGSSDLGWIYNDSDYTTHVENNEKYTTVTIYRRKLE